MNNLQISLIAIAAICFIEMPTTASADCKLEIKATGEKPCSQVYLDKKNDEIVDKTKVDKTKVDKTKVDKTKVTVDFTNSEFSNLNGLRCYSWRTIFLSTASPYVQLLAPEDLNAIPHEIITLPLIDGAKTEDRCRAVKQISFTFPGKIEWIRLFADEAEEGKTALSDTYTPKPQSKPAFVNALKWLQHITEAPGATNIQASWSPSFNGPQKIGIFANLQFLTNIPEHNQWIGISSFLDINNPAQQNLDSAINTITYIAYLTPHDSHDSDKGFKIRPLMLAVRTGSEYALSSDVLNQISTVSLHLPFISPRISNQESPISVTPMAGIETGANFDNRSTMPVHSAIFRSVVGADGSYRFRIPKAEWFLGSKPYTLSGVFRARFPATAEVFTTISSKSSTIETPDRRTRSYGRAELSIPLSKLVAAAVIYQYGDLPPAFRFSGHTISISLKASSPLDYEH